MEEGLLKTATANHCEGRAARGRASKRSLCLPRADHATGAQKHGELNSRHASRAQRADSPHARAARGPSWCQAIRVWMAMMSIVRRLARTRNTGEHPHAGTALAAFSWRISNLSDTRSMHRRFSAVTEHRVAFRELALRCGVATCLIHCRAPREVLQDRILQRRLRGRDASEADVSVLHWQAESWEPIETQ
jgi:hypothetical protein